MCVPSLQENVRLSLALALEMISDSLTMKVSVHAVIKFDKLHSLSLSQITWLELMFLTLMLWRKMSQRMDSLWEPP